MTTLLDCFIFVSFIFIPIIPTLYPMMIVVADFLITALKNSEDSDREH